MSHRLLAWPLLAVLLLSGCASTPRGANNAPIDTAKTARINTQLGVAYMREGQHQQAMDRLQKAVQQDPDLADARVAIALLYDRLGETAQAERHYERAIALAPDDPGALNNFGGFLCRQDKWSRAEPMLIKAASDSLYPTPELPLTNAGNCALRAGERDKAETYFLRALNANPGFTPALLRMAELRNEAGHHLSARGFYQRYITVVPQNPESLLLGIQIEKALNNRDAVGSYSLLLKSKFPDSEQTRRLLEMERNER